MDSFISVVIPNYNGSSTIRECLRAVFSSDYDNYEVIVVDDCSTDGSQDIIPEFPCRIIQLKNHAGASSARNRGAEEAEGDILFFTDSDCILLPDTLKRVNESIRQQSRAVIVGGTYTRLSHDRRFFSDFQSVFINYSETKHLNSPDYIPTHAMAIYKEDFIKIGGFREDFYPIVEDVEFSHRAKRQGYRLVINPDIQVQHIFNYSLRGSLQNACRKSTYWTAYSIENRDILADSGTASIELKVSVISLFIMLFFLLLWIPTKWLSLLYAAAGICFLNFLINCRLFRAFYEAGGMLFALLSVLYYTTLYSFTVGLGAIGGILKYYQNSKTVKK
ncbi:MAG: glycosyltransferase [Nitrospirae bacterium]|nr:glycosyltransferase [Nitrospirota bacterium]